MLFMIIERFKQGGAKSVAGRFKSKGRMLPEGVTCHASWLEPSGAQCFQLMEASGQDALAPWAKCWEDLVDFEVNPVLTSADY